MEILCPGTNAYNADTNSVTVLICNTIADIEYELLSATNLAPTGTLWSVEQTLLAPETTNFIATTVSMAGRSNLFLRALAYTLDSQNTGIPDWWWLRYFGAIGNPYALDSSGDGWTLLQDYQQRFVPGVWNAPPAPTGLTANLVNGALNLAWNPSPGPVIGYTVQRYIPGGWEIVANLPASATSFVDTTFPMTALTLAADPYSDPQYGPPGYQVMARYAQANSPWSGMAYLWASDLGDYCPLFRGPQGRVCLGVWPLPQGTASAALTLVTQDTYPDSVTNAVFDVACYTNGCFVLPQDCVISNVDCMPMCVALFNSQGSVIETRLVSQDFSGQSGFFDGREQIQQNLKFLLRVANASSPFSYTFVNEPLFIPSLGWFDVYAFYGFAPNYVYDGVYDIFPNTYWPGYDPPSGGGGQCQDVFRPFEHNYIYRNFVYSPNDLNGDGTLADVGYCLYGPTLTYPPPYQFSAPANSCSIPAILDNAAQQWTSFYPQTASTNCDLSDYDITTDTNGFYQMAGSQPNVYGLPFESALFASGSGSATLYAGGGGIYAPDGGVYAQATNPVLSTVAYYFTYVGANPMPGDWNFSTTCATPPCFIASFGWPVTVAGFAQNALVNGYSNVYAYAGQYLRQRLRAGHQRGGHDQFCRDALPLR